MYYTNNPSKNDILEAISNLSVSDIMDILSSNNLLDIFKQIPSMIFKSKAFKKIHSFFFTPVKIIESVDKNDDENDPGFPLFNWRFRGIFSETSFLKKILKNGNKN